VLKIRTFALFSERIAHVARLMQPMMGSALMLLTESAKVIIFGTIKARVKYHTASSTEDHQECSRSFLHINQRYNFSTPAFINQLIGN